MEKIQKDLDNFAENYNVELTEETLEILRDLQEPLGTGSTYRTALKQVIDGLIHFGDSMDFDAEEVLSLVRALDLLDRDLAALTQCFRHELPSSGKDIIYSRTLGVHTSSKLDKDKTPWFEIDDEYDGPTEVPAPLADDSAEAAGAPESPTTE